MPALGVSVHRERARFSQNRGNYSIFKEICADGLLQICTIMMRGKCYCVEPYEIGSIQSFVDLENSIFIGLSLTLPFSF